MSDKFLSGYIYFFFEQIDCVLWVWKYYGIIGGYILVYDMGDIVLMELIVWYELDVFLVWFLVGILLVIFINGNMVLEKVKLWII